MTTPKLTDEAVAALPIHDGRVELLEEIMTSPVIDRVTEPTAPRGRRTPRWVAAVGAAAAVATVAAVPIWISQRGDEPTENAPFSTIVEDIGERALLTTPGWTVDNVNESKYGGEIGYSNGDKSLQITWYPADQYDSYVTDRQHISDPVAVDPGEAVEVLGSSARLWAYTSHDHAVILPPGDTWFLEVRGDGMDKQAFLEILGDLRSVDRAGLEAALPERFVTTQERSAAIAEILDAIGTLPPGLTAGEVKSTEPDLYHLGADVAGTVACGWIAEFASAKNAGSEPRMAAANHALQGSRDWPILLEMNDRGDFPEVVWEYADEVAAGRVPEGYRQGLGC